MTKGWIGVDLDGTLAFYDHWRGADHIGAPVPKMVARVKKWLADGQEVRIFTARVNVDKDYEIARRTIQKWCLIYIGQELVVTCMKDMHMISLWDDRAVAVIPNTGDAINAL